ncbi:MAG: hypothetical protein ABFS10_12980 [Bacteroidota bacterium]
MKKQIHILSALLIGIMFLSSCNQVEETGQLKFGFDLTEDATLKSTEPEHEIVAALVSIADASGAIIFDKEYLELIAFGGEFVTRSLKLPVGEFALTEFMLVDAAGEVVWATPKEGSPLAHLVRDPLPQHFGIRTDQTTSLDVQVIRVNDHPPSDFGYAEFNIEFVNRFCLKVLFNYPYIDNGNDSICQLPGPEGAPIHMPRFTIWLGDRPVVDGYIQQGLNRFSVPIANSYYTVTAYGYYGQSIFEQKFSLDELMGFRCGPDFPPLVIGQNPPGIIITPEGLTEPNIRQGVFGQVIIPDDIIVPVDSIWDATGNYVVSPVIRDIYFFPGYYLDSIMTFAEIGCYLPLEMIPYGPAAIVRSNSGGFFQVPLETGEYLYLVKTPNGFFINGLEMSSSRPGHVMVYPEEVTEIVIHLIHCPVMIGPCE